MYDDTYSVVREAIINKYPMIATYSGQRRLLCPHALGSKKGRSQALFYQVAGGSSSGLGAPGSGANWRCMALAKLSEVNFYPGAWYSGGNHSCPHT